MQRSLALADVACWSTFDVPGGDVRLSPGAFSFTRACALLEVIMSSMPWRADTARIAGKSILVPRLQQWVSDRPYTYSGMTIDPVPWTAPLLEIRRDVERTTHASYDAVFLNLYRNGEDCIGWHADDDEEIPGSPIASVSFGAVRDFVLRRKDDHARRVVVPLGHGDLLLMKGSTQALWEHSVPRRKRVTTARLSLTFRQMRPSR